MMFAAVTESVAATMALPREAFDADELAAVAPCYLVAEGRDGETADELAEGVADKLANDHDEFGDEAVPDVFYVTVYTDGVRGRARGYAVLGDGIDSEESWAEEIPTL